jgi:hypothetical protein
MKKPAGRALSAPHGLSATAPSSRPRCNTDARPSVYSSQLKITTSFRAVLRGNGVASNAISSSRGNLKTAFEATQDMRFKRAIRLSNGGVNLSFVLFHGTRAGPVSVNVLMTISFD